MYRIVKTIYLLTLCEVSPGIIWAGGYFSGIYQIDKRTSKTTYFTPALYAREDIRPDKYIRDIRKDSHGYIWTGGYYNLKRINVQTKDIRLYHGLHSVTAIIEKDDKSMWIGTATGLHLLDKGIRKVRTYPATCRIDLYLFLISDKEGITVYRHQWIGSFDL